MKLRTDVTTGTSNFTGKKFNASINLAQVGQVMNSLARNYNEPELAVLREWVSNAHDSHVEAGQTKPIEVTIPSGFNSILTVQDFGVGMSYDEVENTYSVFYGSTKSESNEGIGGFGIGGKSALALADQYTMIAIKDGLKNIFIFERSADGGMEVTPATVNQPTDEHSGVTVSVAIDRDHVFDTKSLTRVLGGWTEDQVQVNGAEFVSYLRDAIDHGVCYSHAELWADDETKAKRSYNYNRYNTFHIMVGPVLYTVNKDFLPGSETDFYSSTNKYSGIIPKVPIGSVTFPSSREVVEPTKANREIIKKAFAKSYEAVVAYLQEQYKDMQTHEEAYKANQMSVLHQLGASLKFRGEEIPTQTVSGKSFHAVYTRKSEALDSYVLSKNADDSTHELKSIFLAVHKDAEASDTRIRQAIRLYISNELKLTGQDFRRSNSLIIIDPEISEWVQVATQHEVKLSEILKLKKDQNKAPTVRSYGITCSAIFVQGKKAKDRHESFETIVEKSDKVVVFPTGPISGYGFKHLKDFVTSAVDVKGTNDSFVAITTKHQIKTLQKVSDKVVTFEDYYNALGEKKHEAPKQKLARMKEIKKTGLNDDVLFELKGIKTLNDSMKNIIDGWDGQFYTSVNNMVGYSSESQLAAGVLRATVKTILGDVDIISSRNRYYSQPSDFSKPFGLTPRYISKSDTETIAYLNWSADRYLNNN